MTRPNPNDGIEPWMWQCLLIILAGLLIYSPAFEGAWLIDDNFYLPHHPLINDPNRLWKTWFQPGSFIEYYPISQTLQIAQWSLWNTDMLGYHLTNVILHIINACLVWRLLDRFRRRFAWLGGLIFMVHPVMIESVAWVAELKNTLSLMPFLLAMCFWLDYEEHRRPRDYCLALGLFLMAMLCKISMALFPFVILIYAWWKRGRIGWKDLFAAAPFALISLVLGIVTIWTGEHYLQTQYAHPPASTIGGFFSRLAYAGTALGFYFTHCFWTVGIAPIYPQWKINPPSLWQFLPCLVWIGGAFWLWQQRSRWGRHGLFGLGFFVLFLLPFLGFNWVSFMTFTPAMDHFLYIPMISLIILVVAAMEQVYDQLSLAARPYGIGLTAVILGLMTWQSWNYAEVFHDRTAYYTYVIRLYPQCSSAHNNMGSVFLRAGQFDTAATEYKLALELNPAYVEAYINLANALTATGHIDEAMEQYRLALKYNPNSAEAYSGMGNTLGFAGRYPEAKTACEEALRLNPGYISVYCMLGDILAKMGDVPGGIKLYQKALSLDPGNPEVQKGLEGLSWL